MTIPAARRTLPFLVAIVIAGAGLTGCTSKSSSAGSPTSAPPGTTSSAGASSPTTAAAAHAAVDVCAILPAATVAQVTGLAVTSGEADDTPSYGLFACNYTGGLNQVRIDVEKQNPKIGYEADLQALQDAGQHPTMVSGIGKGAYTGGVTAALAVLYDDAFIKVDGYSQVTVDQAEQLIEKLHSQI